MQGDPDHELRSVGSHESYEIGSKSSGQTDLPYSDDDENQQQEKQFVKESKAVSRWRSLLILLLLVTAAAVVSGTFIFLSREEEDEYKHAYAQSAETLISSAKAKTVDLVQSLVGMADMMTAEIVSAGQEWPNVVIDHFEIKGAHAREDSLAEVIIFSPHLHDFEREDWETFAVANQGWLAESEKLEAEETSSWHMDGADNEDNHDDHHDEHGDDHHSDSHDKEEGEEAGHHDDGENSHSGEEQSQALLQFMENFGLNTTATEQRISPVIYRLDNEVAVPESDLAQFFPAWQITPPPGDPAIVNYNLATDKDFGDFVNSVGHVTSKPAISKIMFPAAIMNTVFPTEDNHVHDTKDDVEHQNIPHVIVTVPVSSGFGDNVEEVGLLMGVMTADFYLKEVLPVGVNGIHAVISNTCGQVHSYRLNGPSAIYLGPGDQHWKDASLRRTVNISNFVDFVGLEKGGCEYTIDIYPSSAFRDSYKTVRPEVFTAALVGVFIVTSIVFFIYHHNVAHRQAKVLATALKNDAIVSSLFPSNIRDRIMQDAEDRAENDGKTKNLVFDGGNKTKLKSFLEDDPNPGKKPGLAFKSKPIADLFPETTIMFADIVGFTAWSSVREPSQVFMLLETVYNSFDEIAHRRRVFKVETVGDCYVAVAGLPEPRQDHAVVMARYASECHAKLNQLTKELEVTLGPDTGDLDMRFGLHSGPVTAGVLRGDRARFQLFGDTMNMASRMESSGRRGSIHVSQETANLLSQGGKGHWLTPREEKVFIKGKGKMETFWVRIRGEGMASSSSGATEKAETPIAEIDSVPTELVPVTAGTLDAKSHRLVDWNCDLLLGLLRKVVARRMSTKANSLLLPDASKHVNNMSQEGAMVLDEVCEIITLPRFDAGSYSKVIDPETVQLGAVVEGQVRSYVTAIAMMYRKNSFHSFDHASHVAMSVTKLLSRIIAPSDLKVEKGASDDDDKAHTKYASTLHDHTYGITSDPLTQFACVLSALIHDVDHTGVPNAQLIQENTHLAGRYRGKSVAEQNSVDLSWSLLMDNDYNILCKTICATETEFVRFRQLVVNSVMATDIADKDLKKLRNQRWDKAFDPAANTTTTSETIARGVGVAVVESDMDRVNRKATIVIEHLLQASDVAHTMQHWHIYRKWNERLFEEMYTAYMMGRADTDPTEGWYKGELGFFDFYIIPLAKKLKDCGVFGVSSFEYLDYAERNRREWEVKGREVVEEMKIKMEQKRKRHNNNDNN